MEHEKSEINTPCYRPLGLCLYRSDTERQIPIQNVWLLHRPYRGPRQILRSSFKITFIDRVLRS